MGDEKRQDEVRAQGERSDRDVPAQVAQGDGDAGKPAGIEGFQDGKGGTNLPDNPAYTDPASVDDSM